MKPAVRIYFGVGLYIYGHIQSRTPYLEHDFLYEMTIDDIADRLLYFLHRRIGADDPEAK